MNEVTVSLAQLREQTAKYTSLGTGSSAAYTRLDRNLNTNALAIGIGLEAMEFDQEEFPVVVYWPDSDGPATLAFENGLIACLDAEQSATAVDSVEVLLDQLVDLDLLDDETRSNLPINTVESLTQTEVMVPGHVFLSACPECDETLSGDENHCPNCGTQLPDPASLI
jgi:hypothetical protein